MVDTVATRRRRAGSRSDRPGCRDAASTVAIHEDRPETIFLATASGGVWKSTNDGREWRPVFDHYESATIGDVAIAPSNPDVVWVGTGEANILRSSMAGTGVYRSTDGGETFEHRGLTETHHVSRIVIHPKNPDILYVASAGHEYTPNEERGVFKSLDGGASWTHVFYKNDSTAAIDLVMDPKHPDTLYVATAPRRAATAGTTRSAAPRRACTRPSTAAAAGGR